MFIAVCCDRGAPGSTTTTLALGVSALEPTIVVEADPYGGDLALRCTAPGGKVFPSLPTVLTLAAEARSSIDPGLVAGKAQEFTGWTRIVPGHLSAEQAAGVKSWAPLAQALRASALRTVVDLGRIHSGSPTLPVAAAADVLVTVTRPEMGSVIHLRERLERMAPVLAKLRNAPAVVVPVVVTSKRIAPAVVAEVRQLLAASDASEGIADVGWIAWDPVGVERMQAGQVSGKDARTALLRSAATVNEQLERAANVPPGISQARNVQADGTRTRDGKAGQASNPWVRAVEARMEA